MGIALWGLKQEWWVPGKFHRETIQTLRDSNTEVVASKNQTISELSEGRRDDKVAIQNLTRTISEWDVAGKLQTHILDSIRQSSADREAR
ncbi:hypothetical protein L1892_23360 [Gordonia sp. GW1C4-4]|uniref:Uncharacterized protein n=1 Tax=Gordonia tangerina TaxID=2911060 RepID=A0ABS9DTP2_9ACTN|nr:hypothetical protein [Gordonia tangerina]